LLKAAIFDVDGTLVDSVALHVRAWRAAFMRCGRQVAGERIHHFVGAGGAQLVAGLLPKDELDSHGAEVQKLCPQIFKDECLPLVRPLPKVRELFERLKAGGLSIALATTAKGDELKHYERLLGIEPLLDVVTSGAEIVADRPSPEFFRPALDRLGIVRAGEALAIADTPYDMEAARKAGLHAVGVLSGGFDAAELHRAGAENVFRDVADLLANYEGSLLTKPVTEMTNSCRREHRTLQ
jgi:HAD superfamily hydrolase (TIGR01509 family)